MNRVLITGAAGFVGCVRDTEINSVFFKYNKNNANINVTLFKANKVLYNGSVSIISR